MSSSLSLSSLLVLTSASTASTSISLNLSGSLLDTICAGSEVCLSDVTLEGADAGTWDTSSVWAGVETSGEIWVDARLCPRREMTAEVCKVDTGGTVLIGAAEVVVAATVATDTGMTLVIDTVVVMFVVATVIDFSGDDGVVTVANGVGVAPEEVDTGVGILTVFSAVVGGVVEIICSLEGAALAGAVTCTPSTGCDVVTVTVFAFAVVVTLADVVAGDVVQDGRGATDAGVPSAAVVVGKGEAGLVRALVVVTLLFAWVGRDGSVFSADDDTVATGGVVDVLSDMV